MASILIQHTVKDFAAWKTVFDASKSLRDTFGERSAQVFRDAGDPTRVTVLNKWDSMANAQKFASSPELKAGMEKAGVVGPPAVFFLEEE